MAASSKLTVTVTKSSAQSKVTVRSTGKYAALSTNEITIILTDQGLFPSNTEQAFWAAVLAVVGPAIAAS